MGHAKQNQAVALLGPRIGVEQDMAGCSCIYRGTGRFNEMLVNRGIGAMEIACYHPEDLGTGEERGGPAVTFSQLNVFAHQEHSGVLLGNALWHITRQVGAPWQGGQGRAIFRRVGCDRA